MYTSKNHPLPEKKFEVLAAKRGSHCVSIYLPMHKTGKEQNEHLAQANLKSCIKEVHKALAKYQLQEDVINNYLKPIEELMVNIDLWRNPSEGLAIFLDKKGLNYYPFPISFDTQTYVADHFYLKPMLPLYHENGVYYLLELSQDYIKLYEATRYGFKDLYIEDFAPDQLEKAVGFDYKPKMLQFRSGQATHGAGSFHGHGEGKDDDKKELLTFFRAINLGVKKAITDRKAPLILACVDSLYNIYQEANSYPNLYNKHISGDPEFKDKKEMHQQSWELIQEYFKRTKNSKLDLFTEWYHTPKISQDPSEIILAAINGKIDTLFVRKGADLFGVYNKEKNHISFEDSKELNNTSLINLAAMYTFLQNGKVYELDAKEMPAKEQPINALFRF
ncbi:MAG: hypothetical protein KAJ28_10815 [Flavobacteriaceae bacterium]|nr:hypothetical protein [Flavobacteriaceae bacterium]